MAALVDAAVAWEGLYFSTSSRMIRPEGPVPLIFARGIPFSSAIFLAIGDAKMGFPVSSSTLDSSLGECFVGTGCGDGAGASVLGTSESFFSWERASWDAACFATSSAPERSSPCSPITPMREPTAIPLLPSAAYSPGLRENKIK